MELEIKIEAHKWPPPGIVESVFKTLITIAESGWMSENGSIIGLEIPLPKYHQFLV